MFPRAATECALVVGLNSLSSHLPSLLPASSLTVKSHWKQSSGNNCHKQNKKKQKNLFIWSEQQSQWIRATMGSEEKKQERMKPWYSYKRMKSIWTKYISPFSLILFSFFDALGKNNGSCTSEFTGRAPCLVDNYRLAWHWHYQYLGKLFPNYVRRDRKLVLDLLWKEDKNVLSMVSEASDSPQRGNLLSHCTNLYIKHGCGKRTGCSVGGGVLLSGIKKFP